MRDRQMWRKCETEISDLKRYNTQNAVCMDLLLELFFKNPFLKSILSIPLSGRSELELNTKHTNKH